MTSTSAGHFGHVLGRAFANTLIAYAALALVTFVFVLAKEIVEPSRWNPYLGQAAGNAFFVTAVMFVTSPVVFGGALALDFFLRGLDHPRRVVAALALVPPVFFLLVAPSDLVLASSYAAGTLAIGLLTAPLHAVAPPAGRAQRRAASHVLLGPGSPAFADGTLEHLRLRRHGPRHAEQPPRPPAVLREGVVRGELREDFADRCARARRLPLVDPSDLCRAQLHVDRAVSAAEHEVDGVRRVGARWDRDDEVAALGIVGRRDLPNGHGERRVDTAPRDLLDTFPKPLERHRHELRGSPGRDADEDGAALDGKGGKVDGGVLRAAVAWREFALEVQAFALAEVAPLQRLAKVGLGP
jgi:hypothetical protein